MVIKEDMKDSWLAAETDNSSNESILERSLHSNRDTSIRKSVFSYMTKKPTSKMLIEAVKILSNDSKGASVPAITKWISANYTVSDMNNLKLQIKKAVLRALNSGTLVRSEASKGALGSSGSFVIGKENKRKFSRKKSGNLSSNPSNLTAIERQS